MKVKNITICRIGENKLNYLKTKNGVLFDDYGKNGREWIEKEGNEFVKIKTNYSILDYLATNS